MLAGRTSFEDCEASEQIWIVGEARQFIVDCRPRLRFTNVRLNLCAEGLDLANVVVRDSILAGSFRDSCLRDAIFERVDVPMDLRGANFRGARFLRCEMSPVHAAGAEFANCRILQSTLRGSDLSSADFTNARLEECDLDGCKAWDACFRGASFKGSSMMNWETYHTDFRGADFSGVGEAEAPYFNFYTDKLSGAKGPRWLQDAKKAIES